jgi:hypothetical protein
LANSDFYTGAFPAEFGNATSGVFDLRLRNGNSQKHEFMASAGFNGFELGAEGPLSKKTGASYLINARYSFLKALDLIGFKVAAAEGAVPEYQDVSAKVNVPLKNGNLSVVTLIGASKIHITPDMSDDSEWAAGDQGTDVKSSSQQYFVGANYTLRLSPSTRIENRLSYQYISSKALQYNVSYPDESKSLYFDGVSSEGRVSYAPTLHHRINPKNFLVIGAGVDVFMTGLNNILYEDSIPQIVQDADKNSALVKGFVQWQHKFSDVLSITPGVYAQYYGLNNDWSVEPRLGLKWTVTNRSSINVGAGLYSQLQPRQVYFYQDSMGVLVNKDLKLSKSWQTVVGYDLKLTKNMRMKVEAYYQHLFDVAVTPEIPEQSMINLGDGFYNNWDYILENKGTGRNYGVELTLEKFFSNQYYFLVTASLYSSKYKGYDGVERNTKFAGNFTINTIAGYEWKLGKSNLLSVNLKGSLLGGNRFLPSTIQNVGDTDPTYDYAHAYEERLPNYFRIDLNINMKSNFKRFALEWFFELDNITNHKNIWYKTYNVNKQEYDYTYQTGFMPMGGCRVYF